MIGETLGGYRITRKIGEGGMGEVWEAEHIFLGRKAAIKCLLSELSKNAEATGRFFIEARAAAMTNHPSLVDIYDQGHTEQGNAYIIMEFLDGEDLGTLLRRETKLRVKLALSIARQVASALAAVHGKGIVHRDLKPDNLFLVKTPGSQGIFRVKVLDFGIAKLTGPENKELSVKTRTGSVLGTPSYMSPEQCRGHGKIDWRSDVYSLGCILHEMISGQPPFTGTGYGEVLAKHIYEPPPPLRTLEPSVPPIIEQLVLKTLAKTPEQRLQSMDELGNAIDQFLNSAVSLMGIQGVTGPSGTTTYDSVPGVPLPMPPPGVVSMSGPPPAAPPREPTASVPAPPPSGRVNTTLGGTASELIPPEGQGGKKKRSLIVPLGIAGVMAVGIGIAAALASSGSGGSATAATTTPSTEPATPEAPKPPEAPAPKPIPEAPKPEPVAVAPKPEPVAVAPEPPKPEPPKPEPPKPTPEAPKPEPVAVKPEPPKPEPVAVKPEPVAVKPEPVAVKPEPPKPEPPKPTPPVAVVVKPEPPKPEPPKPEPPKPTPPVAVVKPEPPKPAPIAAPPPAPAKVTVKIASDPAGAEVFKADGTRLGKTPYENQLAPGSGKLAFVLKLKGWKDGKAELPADKGGQTSVKLVEEPKIVAAPPSPPPAPTGTKPSGSKGGKTKPVKDGVVNPFK